jgi:hypothetical protein
MGARSLRTVWLGFAIAACVGCHSADAMKPGSATPRGTDPALPSTGLPPSTNTSNMSGIFFDAEGADFRPWMLQPSGNRALDRSAQDALSASRLLPLPTDYGHPRIPMRFSLIVNEKPGNSKD